MPNRLSLWLAVLILLSLAACTPSGGNNNPTPDPFSFKFDIDPSSETVTLAGIDPLLALANVSCDKSEPQALKPNVELSVAEVSASFGENNSLTIAVSFSNDSEHQFNELSFRRKPNEDLTSVTPPAAVASLAAGKSSSTLAFEVEHQGTSTQLEVLAEALVICDPPPPTDPLSFKFKVDPANQTVTLASFSPSLGASAVQCPIIEPQPLTPAEDLLLAATDVSFTFASDNQLTISAAFSNATAHLYENLSFSAKDNERLDSATVPQPVARLGGLETTSPLDFELVHQGSIFFFEVTAMASVTCDTGPPPDPEAFRFNVDPNRGSFDFGRVKPASIDISVIDCALDGPQVLTPLSELAIDETGISFEFLADSNQLNFSLPFVNSTDFVFNELTFMFVASDDLITTTTPPPKAELGPGQTSVPQAFSLTHRGEPFTLQLKVSALVNCEPDPTPVEPPARFGHIMVGFGDTAFLLAGTDGLDGQVSTFDDLWLFSNGLWEKLDPPVAPPSDLKYGDGIPFGNHILLASGYPTPTSNQLTFYLLDPGSNQITQVPYEENFSPLPPFRGIDLLPTGSDFTDDFSEVIFLNGQTGMPTLNDGLFAAFIFTEEGETKASTILGEIFDPLLGIDDVMIDDLDFDGDGKPNKGVGIINDKFFSLDINSASAIFADGFESGDVSSWSDTTPRLSPQQAGSFPHLSSGASVTLGNRMWLFGGFDTDSNTMVDSVIELTFNDPNDFDNVSFRFLEPLAKARGHSEAVILSSDGELRVLIFGGIGADASVLADTHIYTVPLE